MTDEVYAVLAGKYGGISWQCESCLASTARIDATMKNLEARMTKAEGRMDAADERVDGLETRIEKAEMVATAARQSVDNSSKETTTVILEELREREDKKLNVIFHSIGEAPMGPVEDQRKWEEQSLDNIMAAMSADTTARESVRFNRRLGARMLDKPRPLLVGMRSEQVKDHLLEKARNLMKTQYNHISIVPDLTRRQRETDDDLRKEAERRNRDGLTEEERAKNIKWVTVGRKGARKLIKREFREYGSHPTATATTARAVEN